MPFSFNLGHPFEPFEQLMAVLHPTSVELVPEAFRDLMTSPDSPILDFYPMAFELDIDENKREWEAVVKVPFIDADRLLSAMEGRRHLLTCEERKCNSFAQMLKFSHIFAQSIDYPPKSSPFQDIHRCHCKEVIVDFGHTPDGDGTIGLCNGVSLGANSPTGFPSLHILPNTSTLGNHCLNVLGPETSQPRISPNKSVLLTIESQFAQLTSKEIAKNAIGERILIGWPFIWEGLVHSVADATHKYENIGIASNTRLPIQSTRHKSRDSAIWQDIASQSELTYKHRHGVNIGQVEVLVYIQPLVGMRRLENGASVKEYKKRRTIAYPVQTCLRAVPWEDPRFIGTGPKALGELYPIGSHIFFLGDQHYGSIGLVTTITTTGISITIEASPSDEIDEEAFKCVVALQAQSTLYTPVHQVAMDFQMTPKALLAITSSFLVTAPDGAIVDIGLFMKFSRKSMKVIDYTRKLGQCWEYSEKVVDLIRDYKMAFPEVFGCLGDYDGNGILEASELFKNSDPRTRLRDIITWQTTNAVNTLERVPLHYDQLPKTKIAELEQTGDQATSRASNSNSLREITYEKLSTQAVLCSAEAPTRLKEQTFVLGDRVRMIMASGPVPLSAKGVVIGVGIALIDVLWDAPLTLGTTLGNRCTTLRGMTVERACCLNISKPQYMVKLVDDTMLPSPQHHESLVRATPTVGCEHDRDWETHSRNTTGHLRENNIDDSTGWRSPNWRARGGDENGGMKYPNNSPAHIEGNSWNGLTGWQSTNWRVRGGSEKVAEKYTNKGTGHIVERRESKIGDSTVWKTMNWRPHRANESGAWRKYADTSNGDVVESNLDDSTGSQSANWRTRGTSSRILPEFGRDRSMEFESSNGGRMGV